MWMTFAILGASLSLSNASLDINGNLTVRGAALELQLFNASVTVSGDLRIEAGMTPPQRIHHIAIAKREFCIQGVLNVSLSPSWPISSSPIVVTGAYLLDPTSLMAITLPSNPYTGVAVIAVGRTMSVEG